MLIVQLGVLTYINRNNPREMGGTIGLLWGRRWAEDGWDGSNEGREEAGEGWGGEGIRVEFCHTGGQYII
jgi:hypothetical protein